MDQDQPAPEKEEEILEYDEDEDLTSLMEKAKLDSHRTTPLKKAANLETVTPVKRIVNPLAGAQGLCDDDQPLADTVRLADRRDQTDQSAKNARAEKKARDRRHRVHRQLQDAERRRIAVQEAMDDHLSMQSTAASSYGERAINEVIDKCKSLRNCTAFLPKSFDL